MATDYCPCDRCNGRLTGAWEDEEREPRELTSEEYRQAMGYDKDPYEGLCCACGQELTPDHTKETCPEPQYWS